MWLNWSKIMYQNYTLKKRILCKGNSQNLNVWYTAVMSQKLRYTQQFRCHCTSDSCPRCKIILDAFFFVYSNTFRSPHKTSAVIFCIGNVNMGVSYGVLHVLCEPQWLISSSLEMKTRLGLGKPMLQLQVYQ
jgi:hypothetical protein